MNFEPEYKIPEIGSAYIKQGSCRNLPKVENPEECYKIFKSIWYENRIDLLHEFKTLLVDTNMRCIAIAHNFNDGRDHCIVNPRSIFETAFKYYASGIVLAHNHRGGDLTPTKSDIDFTQHMVLAGSLLGLKVHDHLILSSAGYLSFAKESMIPNPRLKSTTGGWCSSYFIS